MRHAPVLFTLAALLSLTACGDEGEGADNTSMDPDDMQAGSGSGAGDDDLPANFSIEESEVIAEAPEFLAESEDGWLSLVEFKWELEANTESYRCVRVTVPQDTYISAFKPLTPVGTHHTVLSLNAEPDAEDGVTECTAFVNGPQQIGGSGVGTKERELPEGVAIRLLEGQQLLLNLHLFNLSDDPLTGTSGMLVRTTTQDDVVHFANSMLAGPINLDIPPGRVTQTGQCTLQEPGTLIAIFPHMHQLGVHMKVTLLRSSGDDLVLHDAPYNFDDQQILSVDDLEFVADDQIEVECTYENYTEETVVWGDSSKQEMCFAGLLRYPEVANGFCIQ